jgi:hypothetical protein
VRIHLIVLLFGASACGAAGSSVAFDPEPDAGAAVSDGGKSDAHVPPDAAAPPRDAAPLPGPDAGAACNFVVQQGAPAPILSTKTSAASPAGGSILDGTWIMTSSTLWSSPYAEGATIGTAHAATWIISGNIAQVIMTSPDGTFVERRTVVLSFGGPKMGLRQTCSTAQLDPNTALAGYTATDTTLRMVHYAAGELETVLTRK